MAVYVVEKAQLNQAWVNRNLSGLLGLNSFGLEGFRVVWAEVEAGISVNLANVGSVELGNFVGAGAGKVANEGSQNQKG